MYAGLLRFLNEYFLKTVVKSGQFTLLNADWGAEITGNSLEVDELMTYRLGCVGVATVYHGF